MWDAASGRRLVGKQDNKAANCLAPITLPALHPGLPQEAALMTTGFPVPAGYGSANLPPPPGSGMLWRLRNPPRPEPAAAAGGRRVAPAASGGPGGGDVGTPVLPVFRAAPYSAEAARQRRASPTARILFLDDGCTCRAVLAQALMQGMLKWVLARRGRAGGRASRGWEWVAALARHAARRHPERHQHRHVPATCANVLPLLHLCRTSPALLATLPQHPQEAGGSRAGCRGAGRQHRAAGAGRAR